MGSKGKEIVGMDVKELIVSLNKAFSDEWLAYYQYWIGARGLKGVIGKAIAVELEEHAKEELEHAEKLLKRILQLGGTPVLKPEDWYKQSICGYEAPPEDFCEKTILKQNIKGERCAIAVYQKLSEKVKDKDPITYQLLLEILKDEIEHEDDLENLLEKL